MIICFCSKSKLKGYISTDWYKFLNPQGTYIKKTTLHQKIKGNWDSWPHQQECAACIIQLKTKTPALPYSLLILAAVYFVSEPSLNSLVCFVQLFWRERYTPTGIVTGTPWEPSLPGGASGTTLTKY